MALLLLIIDDTAILRKCIERKNFWNLLKRNFRNDINYNFFFLQFSYQCITTNTTR